MAKGRVIKRPNLEDLTDDLRDRVTKEMKALLKDLGLPYDVVWNPDPKAERLAYVEGDKIHILAEGEGEAWRSLAHELIEIKLKDLTSFYLDLINAFISAFEKLAYKRKESAIDWILTAVEEVMRRGSKWDSRLEGIQ